MKKIQKEIYSENGELIKLSCLDCKQELEVANFFKTKKRPTGYNAYCKKCWGDRRRDYYKNNRDKIIKKTQEYTLKNQDRHKNWEKEWREKNKERIKNRRKIRKKTNPTLKLRDSISRRILLTLKRANAIKTKKTEELLGEKLEVVRQHLESQFRDGMTWDNHGKIWHIDHIEPCCSFNLTIEDEQKKCFNYKNLRPLLISENLKKAAEDKKRSILS